MEQTRHTAVAARTKDEIKQVYFYLCYIHHRLGVGTTIRELETLKITIHVCSFGSNQNKHRLIIIVQNKLTNLR